MHKGQMVSFSHGGLEQSGYLAAAGDERSNGSPAVIVFQEWWGLNDQIRGFCDRLAGAGLTALAPDLYNGKVVSEPDEAAKAMMALNMTTAASQMSGAVDYLIDRSGRGTVGVTGFCMGGGLALVLGCQRPDAVGAVVPFYGVIPWADAQPDYSKLAAKVQGHFAELDDFASPAAVSELQATLEGLGVENEFYTYVGTQHAFTNELRPEVYDAQATALSFERAISFLSANG